jgi:hypothetical protein
MGAACLVVVTACSKEDTTPPVAVVSFQASKTRVPVNSPIEFTYEFVVAPNAAINGNYRVFMHVVDPDGNQMQWNDDHDPPIPTSQWKPGMKVRYTHLEFVPVFPTLGEVMVEVGLHREGERLPLQGPDPTDKNSKTRSYKVGTLQLLPSRENIFLNFRSGWHPIEFAPENPSLDWQWTQKAGVIALRNPRKDSLLYLDYDARIDVFADHPQQVTVYAGDQPVTTFTADSGARRTDKIPISAAQWGSSEQVELRIAVDRTFMPAKLPAGGKDLRELGIRVYHAFVEVR